MQFPKVSLSRGTILPGNFDEAVIETQIVSDRILPCWPALAIVRKLLDNVITDFSKCQHLIWRLRNGHCDESNVRIWGFDIVLVALRGGGSLLAIPVFLAIATFLISIAACCRIHRAGAGFWT